MLSRAFSSSGQTTKSSSRNAILYLWRASGTFLSTPMTRLSHEFRRSTSCSVSEAAESRYCHYSGHVRPCAVHRRRHRPRKIGDLHALGGVAHSHKPHTLVFAHCTGNVGIEVEFRQQLAQELVRFVDPGLLLPLLRAHFHAPRGLKQQRNAHSRPPTQALCTQLHP
jgi:hypothetical protein